MAKGTANRPFSLLSQAATLNTIVADDIIRVQSNLDLTD